MSYDLIVIGAGPGGYVAAIKGAQVGLKVLLIEQGNLGGTCLNWGCIPTKALLKSAEVLHVARNAQKYGVLIPGAISIDYELMLKRAESVVHKLNAGIKMLLESHKVDVLFGRAVVYGSNAVVVNEKQYLARNIIIATGSRPRLLEGLEPNGRNVFTAKEIFGMRKLPESICIIGGGAIGVEFASLYSILGVQVTLIESGQYILANEDREISVAMAKALQQSGVTLHTEAKVLSAVVGDSSVTLDIGHSKIIAQCALVAVGIEANIECIKGVETASGRITTNQHMQTNIPNVYAIGDVTTPPALAHKASHDAIVAVSHIAGIECAHHNQYSIPSCVYSIPEVASIGLSEQKAISLGHKVRVGKFAATGNGKSLASGFGEGFVKVVFDYDTGEILGTHMFGHNVTEMIGGVSIAKAGELVDKDLLNTIFPHPTLSEMIHEAALDAYGVAIHAPKSK